MIERNPKQAVTNELRRAIAARMCELSSENKYISLDALIVKSIGDDLPDGMGYDQLLAELIDRPACRIVHDENRDCDVCTNCSTSFELAEFDYADANVFEGYSYCPKCGAKVVP